MLKIFIIILITILAENCYAQSNLFFNFAPQSKSGSINSNSNSTEDASDSSFSTTTKVLIASGVAIGVGGIVAAILSKSSKSSSGDNDNNHDNLVDPTITITGSFPANAAANATVDKVELDGPSLCILNHVPVNQPMHCENKLKPGEYTINATDYHSNEYIVKPNINNPYLIDNNHTNILINFVPYRVKLKIAELNVANYDDFDNADTIGKWEDRKQLIADAIINSGADIIALQEIRGNSPNHPDEQDMAQQLLQELRTKDPDDFSTADFVTDEAMQYQNGTWEGLSIIYKNTVTLKNNSYFSLTADDTCGDINNRILQYAEFSDNKDNKTFYLFNTHLSYIKLCRDETVPQLITHIKNIEEQASNPPVFLVGDLNAATDPNSPSYDESMTNQLTSAGFNDLWKENYDIKIDPGYTFSSQTPVLRCDYAWANQYFMNNNKSSIELFATNATGSCYPADHFGLVFDILTPL